MNAINSLLDELIILFSYCDKIASIKLISLNFNLIKKAIGIKIKIILFLFYFPTLSRSYTRK
jgi:hypothetical protein